MPTASLCSELLKQYQCQTKSQLSSAARPPQTGAHNNGAQPNSLAAHAKPAQPSGGQLAEHTNLDDEYLVAKKRRVVKFVRCWLLITRQHFFQQHQIQSFLTVSSRKWARVSRVR